MRDDDIIRRIEHFPFRRGPVAAEWRNKGYTLINADTGRPLARLRPYGRDDLMEVRYWSLWKRRWAPGRRSVHSANCRSTRRSPAHHRQRTNLLGCDVIRPRKMCKVELKRWRIRQL